MPPSTPSCSRPGSAGTCRPPRSIRPTPRLLAAFLDHVDVVVAVHGFGRQDMFTTLLLGGRNRDLGRHVGPPPAGRAARVRHRRRRSTASPGSCAGCTPTTPSTGRACGGVQLELPPRVRGLGPFWTDFRAEHGDDVHPPHTEALIGALAAAATTWTGLTGPTGFLDAALASSAMELRVFIEPQQGASYAAPARRRPAGRGQRVRRLLPVRPLPEDRRRAAVCPVPPTPGSPSVPSPARPPPSGSARWSARPRSACPDRWRWPWPRSTT